MAISTEKLDGGITLIKLDGSLDIAGAAAIDLKMNVIAGSAMAVIVDLENVTFIGSMGLRSLLSPARAVMSRGGKMAILKPNQLVEKVLTTSGIDTMIPVFHDVDAAVAAVQ